MKVKNTRRLKFDLMNENDVDLLFNLDQNKEVMRYVNGGKNSTIDEIKNILLPRMLSYSNQEKGWGLWKVTELTSDQFIGWILIRPMGFFTDSPQFNNLEMGWRFFQKSWGQGFATEAAEQIKNTLISQGTVKKLTALAFEENLASINIMKKIGMTFLKKEIHKDPLGEEELVFYELSIT